MSKPCKSQHVAVRHIPRADKHLIEQLGFAGCATVHEAHVLTQPGDNWMLHVAIELCQPGDVLVVACTAINTDGMFGDLLATSAQAHGVTGMITDTGCRDVADLV